MGRLRGRERKSEKQYTYIYVILLLKLFTIDSGCHLNTYITAAQLSDANAGHALSCILVRASGVINEERGCMFGCTERLAKASTTRAKTYMTIFHKSETRCDISDTLQDPSMSRRTCWLTLPGFLPNTT